MRASFAPVCLLAFSLAFVGGVAGSVFVTDQLEPTFPVLTQRQCLPNEINSTGQQEEIDCDSLATSDSLPKKCEGVPALALFYICFARSQGLLDDEPAPQGDMLDQAVSSIFSQLKYRKLQRGVNNGEWVGKTYQILDDCEQKRTPDLSLRQTAVYSFLCLKWWWFSDCDCQQERNGSLDVDGTLRRNSFFSGNCPLSPKSLKAVLESVASRTFDQCSVGSLTGDDVIQLYDDNVASIRCLLEDYETGNKIDYSTLKDAIASELFTANAAEAEILMKVVRKCDGYQSSEDFVRCWASFGVISCVYQEANKVAGEFPDQCTLSIH